MHLFKKCLELCVLIYLPITRLFCPKSWKNYVQLEDPLYFDTFRRPCSACYSLLVPMNGVLRIFSMCQSPKRCRARLLFVVGKSETDRMAFKTVFNNLYNNLSMSVCGSVCYLLPHLWSDLNFKGTHGFLRPRRR